jgi:hypothetical protein
MRCCHFVPCYTLQRLVIINLCAVLQCETVLSKVSYRYNCTTDHQRPCHTTVFSRLNNAIHPLRNQITENTKGEQSSSNTKEPVQILDILAWNYALQMSVAVVVQSQHGKTYQFIPQIPVTTFIGSTMVPRTVSLPRMSDVFSWRSFILMLI